MQKQLLIRKDTYLQKKDKKLLKNRGHYNNIIMEQQNITNLLDNKVGLNASNQLSKFRTGNWVEINDESRGTYTSNDIKFKTTLLRSNLYDYADAYILLNGTITITGAGDDDAAKNQMKEIKV